VDTCCTGIPGTVQQCLISGMNCLTGITGLTFDPKTNKPMSKFLVLGTKLGNNLNNILNIGQEEIG